MENIEKTGRDEKAQAEVYNSAEIDATSKVNACPLTETTSTPDESSTNNGFWDRWLPWLVLAFALILRLAWLGIKPPHFDEGVNGWFIDQMKNQGFYHYDPGNYHGPFHFYVLFLAQ